MGDAWGGGTHEHRLSKGSSVERVACSCQDFSKTEGEFSRFRDVQYGWVEERPGKEVELVCQCVGPSERACASVAESRGLVLLGEVKACIDEEFWVVGEIVRIAREDQAIAE